MRSLRITKTGAIALGSVLVVLLACHDLTAPLRDRLRPAKSSSPLNPPGPVVVSPDNMRGWAFYDDQHGVACGDASKCSLVGGPAPTPAGAGSMELTTASASEGTALILADYAGVRFDNITGLSYSTYRQSDDAGNNLAIALQLNVDYDLTDQSVGYQGRVVFEPYQGNGGQVVAGVWQSWDARSGRWWGTKSTVWRNGALVVNPCVQSSPCSWTQLLATFPNAGIHGTYGAVILKAGSGWANFRGNVDQLVIAINGASTTFDFESSTPVAGYSLHTEIESGLTVAPASTDTTYAPGAVVHYAFTPQQGHDAPAVILDDSLVAASGDLLMDRPHLLRAAADSTLDASTLTSLGQAIATRLSTMLTAGDKVEAYRELIEFSAARLTDGVDPAAFSAAADRAAYVTYDLDRDAEALDAVDDALAGYNFDIYDDATGAAPYIYAYSTREAIGAPSTSIAAPPTMRAMRAWYLRAARPDSGQLDRSAAGPSLGLSAPAAQHMEIATDPENPQEITQVLYLNGIRTTHDEAAVSLSRLNFLVMTLPRFNNNHAYVTLHYTRNHDQEMKDYDAAHPCVRPAARDLQWRTFAGTYDRYKRCAEARRHASLLSQDLVEAVGEVIALENNFAPLNADVDSLARMVSAARKEYSNAHVLIVAHSQGNLIAAQAVQELPALDGHPVQWAPRCVASLALASPIRKDLLGLDDQHKDGFIVQGDIILHTKPAGYEILPTAKSAAWSSAISGTKDAVLKAAITFAAEVDLHSIDNTYLALPETKTAILQRLTELHRECVPGRLVVTPDSLQLAAGTQASLDAHLYNQHDRPLLRPMTFTVDDPYWVSADSLGVVSAHVPTDSLRKVVWVQPAMTQLWLQVPVRVPPTTMSGSTTKADTAWWEGTRAHNGPNGDPVPLPPEAQFGSSCGQEITLDGPTGSGASYVLVCRRTFFFTPTRLTDGLYAPLVSAYAIRITRNGSVLLAEGKLATEPDPLTFTLNCGYGACFDNVVFFAVERHGVVIARSGPLQWTGGNESRIGPGPVMPAGTRPITSSARGRP